jgi:hypothetical protein
MTAAMDDTIDLLRLATEVMAARRDTNFAMNRATVRILLRLRDEREATDPLWGR